MSEVVNYANNSLQCFCQVKLDSGERVLVSIANLPSPSTKLIRMNKWGLLPKETIWELSSKEAGGIDAYVAGIMDLFDISVFEHANPLDAFRDKLLSLSSIEEVEAWLKHGRDDEPENDLRAHVDRAVGKYFDQKSKK